MLEREEFIAAARRVGEQDGTKTGSAARDWMIAQGEAGR